MAADPLVGKVLSDRFEILERIGEGGTGVVYKAKQITVDRIIAIKVLGAHVSTDPSWVKRFHNEARAAARLENQHTVRVIDFGQTKEGLLFIAMELLHGRSLRDEIDKLGRVPVTRALDIIAQACESVGEAHAQGIIHRDIKPDNLYLLDSKGGADFVKVLDFSVAKLDDPNSQQTRAGVVFGTPAYMSPEQGRGGQLGGPSDIYGFGIVLYEMLNGKPPFDSKIPTEVVMMHLRDKPPPLQGVPEVVSRLVTKALDKDPARRQKSCDELAEECQNALRFLTGGMQAMRPVTGSHGALQPNVVVGPGPTAGGSGMGGAGFQGGGGQMGGMGGGQMGANVPSPEMVAQVAAAQARMGQKGAQATPDMATMVPDLPQRPNVSPMGGMMQPQRPAPQASPQWGAPPMQIPSSQATMMAPEGQPLEGGAYKTMQLPPSDGVVTFNPLEAQAAREAAVPPPPAGSPAGAMFWAGWALVGIGIGLVVHYFLLTRQLAALAGS